MRRLLVAALLFAAPIAAQQQGAAHRLDSAAVRLDGGAGGSVVGAFPDITDNTTTDTVTVPTLNARNVVVTALATPTITSPLVVNGTPGVTTYGYKRVDYLADGTSTAASAEVTIATGNATLSAVNSITVSWPALAGSVSTRLYRTTGGAAPPKLLYTGTATTFDDVGAAGTAQTPATNNGTGQVLAKSIFVNGYTPSGIALGVTGSIAGSDIFASTYSSITGGSVVSFPAAATLQLGAAAANSDGVDQRLQTQGGITGTDRAAGDLDLTTGLGTGTGYSKVTISAPTRVGTGTTAQSRAVKATIDDTGVTANIGTGTATARVGGVLHVSTTAQATTGTAEEVLATYTMPANTLARDGQAVRITAWGITAANANTKVIRVRLGGIAGTIIALAIGSLNNLALVGTATVVRTGASTQSTSGAFNWNSGVATSAVAGSATLSGAIDIVVTGTTATAAGDLTFYGLLVEALN